MITGRAPSVAWYAVPILIAALGSQPARSDDAPLSRKTAAAFACLHKFAVELDDPQADAASLGAVVASRCSKEIMIMAEEGADEETHNFLAREGFLRGVREQQAVFGIQVVLEERARKN